MLLILKFLHCLLASFNSFLMNSCFSSSSINAKQKFWVVLHLLHMCVIFFLVCKQNLYRWIFDKNHEFCKTQNFKGMIYVYCSTIKVKILCVKIFCSGLFSSGLIDQIKISTTYLPTYLPTINLTSRIYNMGG